MDLPPAKPGSLALVKDKKGALRWWIGAGRGLQPGLAPVLWAADPACSPCLLTLTEQHVHAAGAPSLHTLTRTTARRTTLASQPATATATPALAPPRQHPSRPRSTTLRRELPAFLPARLLAGEILAKGYYDPKCAIAFRACALKERLDEEMMQRRMVQAIQLRKACVTMTPLVSQSCCCRQRFIVSPI